MRSVKLAPSIIASDWSRPLETVRALEQCGVEWLHWDAMDGRFVPNITLGPMFLEALRPHTELHFDAHLMIENPGAYIGDFLRAGANSISVHQEGNPHLHKLIESIKSGGALAGVVLNPGTPVGVLEAVLPDVDFVLVMSVNPGFSGQKYLPVATEKMAQLATLRAERGLQFLIQVDGGMSPQTAPEAVRAGADVLVCGASAFYGEKTIAENVAALRAAVDQSLR